MLRLARLLELTGEVCGEEGWLDSRQLPPEQQVAIALFLQVHRLLDADNLSVAPILDSEGDHVDKLRPCLLPTRAR